MPKILYVERNFNTRSVSIIERANQVLEEYADQGFVLTLRQLYYQFVARGWIPNRQSEYDKLGSVINDARLAGLIDWEAIIDRTRELRSVSHWRKPGDIIESAAESFRMDKWRDQPYRFEVWIEKDALIGVIEDVCNDLDIGYFSCRGYTSASEMWVASQRLERYLDAGQEPIILHFGDHDPSGIDMTRDIDDRLRVFLDGDDYARRAIDVRRLALTREQIDQYNPPPNPAKVTDSRYAAYVEEHGPESWELDALEPAVIAELIRSAVEGERDDDLWQAAVDEEARHRRQLALAARQWAAVADWLAKRADGKPPR